MANHDWTRPKSKVTIEKVFNITDVIVSNVQQNGGRWTATIADIMDSCGETDEEEYGTYLQAIDMAIKTFGLRFEKSGRNGRTYSIDAADLADFYVQKTKLSHVFEVNLDVTIVCSHCSTPTNYTINIREKH